MFQLVGQVEVVLLVDHRRERDVLVGDLEQIRNVLDRNFDAFGDLFRGRRPLELRAEVGLGLADAIEQVGLLLWKPERAALVAQGMDDRLPDPPDRIGDELDLFLRIEALGRLDQADVALVDQVQKGEPAPAVALGVGDHEAQIRLDEDP